MTLGKVFHHLGLASSVAYPLKCYRAPMYAKHQAKSWGQMVNRSQALLTRIPCFGETKVPREKQVLREKWGGDQENTEGWE